MRSRLVPLAMVLVLALVGAGSATAASLPTLYIDYIGQNCIFTLKGDGGSKVTTIAPGKYQIELTIEDPADTPCGALGLPDFQLSGPGVLIRTPVDGGVGNSSSSYTVVFNPGSTYVAQDMHAGGMAIAFATATSGTPDAPATPTNSAKTTKPTNSTDVAGSALTIVGSLKETVSSSGALTLTYKGKNVSSFVAGRYAVTVTDHSNSHSFIIQRVHGLSTVTGNKFTGTATTVVEFGPGTMFFYPNLHDTKKSSFVVVSASS